MNRADESDDEGEDEVVREFDVYVSDMTHLHMLQFPLRPVYSDCPNISSAKFKPNHKSLELQVPYDKSIFSADNYDRPTEQKLVSSKMDQKNFLSVAVIRDGDLHITPLQEVLQIKPSFENIKSREITEEMSDDDDDEVDKKKAPIQQVHIRRKENERAESVRKHSYMHMKNTEKAESWVPLVVHDIDSGESTEHFEELYHTNQ